MKSLAEEVKSLRRAVAALPMDAVSPPLPNSDGAPDSATVPKSDNVPAPAAAGVLGANSGKSVVIGMTTGETITRFSQNIAQFVSSFRTSCPPAQYDMILFVAEVRSATPK